MKRFLFSIFLLFGFSTFIFSQTEKPVETKTEITVCPIKLTEYGKTSNFQFSYRYIVETDASGAVSKITKLHKEYPKFVDDENFIPCIEKWKLSRSQKTFVVFFVGTTSKQKFISISNKIESIKILL